MGENRGYWKLRSEKWVEKNSKFIKIAQKKQKFWKDTQNRDLLNLHSKIKNPSLINKYVFTISNFSFNFLQFLLYSCMQVLTVCANEFCKACWLILAPSVTAGKSPLGANWSRRLQTYPTKKIFQKKISKKILWRYYWKIDFEIFLKKSILKFSEKKAPMRNL